MTLVPPDLQRRLDQLAVVARRPRAGSMQGERRSVRRARNVEFADFRPYSPGDDLRQIDWNAYARLDRFFLRLFVEEDDAVVHILVDSSKSMGWGSPSKLEFAQAVAACLGYMALSRLEWVQAANYDTQLAGVPRPRRGRGAMGGLFASLKAIAPAGQTALGPTMRRYLAAARRPGPLVIISDLYDETWREGALAAAGARFDVTLIHVLSREEMRPTLEGELRLVDDESGHEVDVSMDGDMVDRYAAALAEWQTSNAAWCAKRAVAYVPVAADFPLDEFVFGVLRGRGVVAATSGA